MLVDAHLDLAYNALAGYDPRLPLDEARDSPTGRAAAARGQTPTVTLPALRAGGIGLIFGTLFVLPVGAPGDLEGESYATPEQAGRLASRQIDLYRELEDEGLVRLIATRGDLGALVAAWNADRAAAPIGVVMLMEGADPVREASDLERWTDRGVRVVGPAWLYGTRYSGGDRNPGPLTAAGRDLMHELQRTRTALDASHMADESFWQALRLFNGPVIASHSNSRRLVPGNRQLSDDMIRAIVDRDGVIGTVLYNQFLDARWVSGDRKDAVRLEAAVRHVEHICDLARDTRHVGIGTDLDGGFGREGIPAELDSCADLPLVGQALLAAGWHQDEVDAVVGGNWRRWLEQTLPAG